MEVSLLSVWAWRGWSRLPLILLLFSSFLFFPTPQALISLDVRMLLPPFLLLVWSWPAWLLFSYPTDLTLQRFICITSTSSFVYLVSVCSDIIVSTFLVCFVWGSCDIYVPTDFVCAGFISYCSFGYGRVPTTFHVVNINLVVCAIRIYFVCTHCCGFHMSWVIVYAMYVVSSCWTFIFMILSVFMLASVLLLALLSVAMFPFLALDLRNTSMSFYCEYGFCCVSI